LRSQRDDHQTWQQRNGTTKEFIHKADEKARRNQFESKPRERPIKHCKVKSETTAPAEDSNLNSNADGLWWCKFRSLHSGSRSRSCSCSTGPGQKFAIENDYEQEHEQEHEQDAA
jgi:hypothetical protein